MKKKRFFLVLLLALFVVISGCSNQTTDKKKEDKVVQNKDLILATTTSTQDSGLLDILQPLFEEESGYKVKTIAVGTGQALEMGKKGEADVLLVHAPAAEMELMDSGDAINRKRVMYNDFIIIGPSSDPAGIKGLDVKQAFEKIAAANATFISRGDDSGTHKKELAIWKSINVDPKAADNYLETGQGMGPTLNVTVEKLGYTLTDRATFLAQEKNLKDLTLLVEGDEDLLNIYHVMQVNPEKHDKVNSEGAKAFVEFLIDEETQQVIEDFGKEEFGQSLFFKYTE
ncbi:substrate-binding domain-containing protein [Pseudoneobacillus rhizosphaerae]|uniref:Tungstate-binding protein TupA n=1 Tax=Pseudoneobacillus rhizosphaerae TaxID=2880968 RepID=A0A9C7LBN6_9BACI|nr:substrate-binding domain-containing protein [Pseudoneobacillus rhizosphaerae]CAG9609632.1 Tungstate-binding protein TupA [Pseudoneobacillus rhizosphaerae]